MPLVIEEMNTSLEIRDEIKVRRLVREEIARALADERRRGSQPQRPDPADPAAAGRPEGRGGLAMTLAVSSLAKVAIELLDDVEIDGFLGRKLLAQFNPAELSVERDTSFAEVAIPGLDAPVLQYVRGGGERLTLELFFDLTDTMEDGLVTDGNSVKERFIAPLQRLTVQHPTLHAPPVVRVIWGAQVIIASAVATSLSVSYSLFDRMGRPIRATARLGLRQHASASAQIAEAALMSPDLTSAVVVREGDTLPAIALREYGDAARWRPIASANRLTDPLALRPGQALLVPKIV